MSSTLPVLPSMTYVQSTPPHTHAWLNFPTTTQGCVYHRVAKTIIAQEDHERGKQQATKVKEEARRNNEEKQRLRQLQALEEARKLRKKQQNVDAGRRKQQRKQQQRQQQKEMEERSREKLLKGKAKSTSPAKGGRPGSSPAKSRDSTRGVHGNSRGMPPNEHGGTVGEQVAAQVMHELAKNGLKDDRQQVAVEECRRLKQRLNDMEREAKISRQDGARAQKEAKKAQEQQMRELLKEEKQDRQRELERELENFRKAREQHHERQPPAAPEQQAAPGKSVADQARQKEPPLQCTCNMPCLADKPETGTEKPVCLNCNRTPLWKDEAKAQCTCNEPKLLDHPGTRAHELLCGECGSFLSHTKRQKLHHPPAPSPTLPPPAPPPPQTLAIAEAMGLAGWLSMQQMSPHMMWPPPYMHHPDSRGSRVQELPEDPRPPVPPPSQVPPPLPSQEPQPAAQAAQLPGDPPASPGQQSNRDQCAEGSRGMSTGAQYHRHRRHHRHHRSGDRKHKHGRGNHHRSSPRPYDSPSSSSSDSSQMHRRKRKHNSPSSGSSSSSRSRSSSDSPRPRKRHRRPMHNSHRHGTTGDGSCVAHEPRHRKPEPALSAQPPPPMQPMPGGPQARQMMPLGLAPPAPGLQRLQPAMQRYGQVAPAALQSTAHPFAALAHQQVLYLPVQ